MCKHLWSIPYIKHGQTEMKSCSVSSDPSNIRYMEHCYSTWSINGYLRLSLSWKQ